MIYLRYGHTNGQLDILKGTPNVIFKLHDFSNRSTGNGESLRGWRYYRFLAGKLFEYRLCRYKYGVNSKEVQDTYLRLDQDMSAF